jgi:hypothetical protein
MAGKNKSTQSGSQPASGRPSPEGASTDSDPKAKTSAAERKNPHALDPGAAKLHSPVGPLMWLLVPFLLCVVIMFLKR